MSASNLLAGLLKSGFKPNTSDHASSRAQPPLSSVMACFPASSASENATLEPHVPNSVRPPLPPGPPPTQKADNLAPLSSLLSSLVVKGLTSSPSTDSSAAVPVPGKPSKSSPSTSVVSASARTCPWRNSSSRPVARGRGRQELEREDGRLAGTRARRRRKGVEVRCEREAGGISRGRPTEG
jgi:pre-mRNA cleavage complex 2 protein Pcf11/serine/threonine-protein kinase CTR1